MDTAGDGFFAAVRRSAATSSDTGAVMKVGRNAVTPVSGSRRDTSAHSAGSAATKSTPKHPLIWMSTRPGTSTPDGRSTSGRTPPYVSPATTPTITPSETATQAGPSGTLSATTRGARITCTGTSPGQEH